jgi:hypothetical protein
MKALSKVGVLALAAALLATVSRGDQEKDKDKKPAEAVRIAATVDEAIKEFGKDRDAAWKKFTPPSHAR